MKKLWQVLGVMAFWAMLPALMVYLGRGERTRMVIASGSKIVVVKGWLSSGKWILPGGGLHAGEDPLQGVLREVLEETGIRLDGSHVKALFREAYHYRGIRFPCRYFYAELPEAVKLKPQFFEIVELAWMERSALNAKNANPDVLSALRYLDGK